MIKIRGQIQLLAILVYMANAKLLRFELKKQTIGSVETDYIHAFTKLNLSKTENSDQFDHMQALYSKVEKKGVYTLALSQGRNKASFHLDLLLGKARQPLSFMIDTGKNTIRHF
jgi:hypothetical protein